MFMLLLFLVQSKMQTDSTDNTHSDFTVGTKPELNSSTLDWCFLNYDS